VANNKEPKFKSGFEERVYHAAVRNNLSLKYEPRGSKMLYTLPERSYTPDFILSPSGVVVETKGFLRYDDLRKMIAVKEANPDKDIRIVFQKAKTLLRKGGTMNYGQWATKAGFEWAEGTIPDAWFEEKATHDKP
jgi:hypothetical protein